MILNKEKIHQLCEIAQQNGVRELVLFGSALSDPENAKDVDLAVEGAPQERYFEFWAKLSDTLKTEVDLIDLSRKTKFTDLVRKYGKRIYSAT